MGILNFELKMCRKVYKYVNLMHFFFFFFWLTSFRLMTDRVIAGSLESANSSILAARRHFKEVVGKKIRILL